MARLVTLARSDFLKETPPLLDGDPFGEDDGFDQDRVTWVEALWNGQNDLLLDRDRTIEQHVRMIAGQQWCVWSSARGMWVDLLEAIPDEERMWRYYPVLNKIFHWFMLLHARATENPPVITFQPGGGDRTDAELAEAMDVVYKHLWYATDMLEVVDELMAWLIPAGTAYLKSRVDPLGGDPIEFRGPALVGEQIIPDAPFGPDGQPRISFNEAGDLVFGEPHVEYEGKIVVDVLNPLEVRGQWGAHKWAKKFWQLHRPLLTPEEIWDSFGVEVEPTIIGDEAMHVNTYRNLVYGSGYYGASQGRQPLQRYNAAREGFAPVYELWQRPGRFAGTERTNEKPGGRLLVVAGKKRIRDGQRYAEFEFTSPIRCFDFVNVKGRPSGTSGAEPLVGIQRTYNRLWSQVLQHATIVANPVKYIDRNAGIEEIQMVNVPGATVEVDLFGGQPPVVYGDAPSLGRDVWRSTEGLHGEFNELGNIAGAEGTPPSSESSGRLVEELRFNADRYIGPTMRRAVVEFARLARDWRVMIPQIWTGEKVVRAAGDEYAATTITLMPEMFERGSVNVRFDIESMLPESRGERRARVLMHYREGLYGVPGSFEARRQFFELSRFPHMSREARPGGRDRETAEIDVGLLVHGAAWNELPWYDWYDPQIHLLVLEDFMKSTKFRRLDEERQYNMAMRRWLIQQAALVKLVGDADVEAQVQGELARKAVQVEGAVAQEATRQIGNVAPGPPARGPTAISPRGRIPAAEEARA